MKDLERQKDFARLNGARYVRYAMGNIDAALLVHEQAIEEMRAIDAAIVHARAPSAAWQVVYSSGGAMTCRMQVPGGWIVKHSSADGCSLCFSPDPKHTWKTKIEREA